MNKVTIADSQKLQQAPAVPAAEANRLLVLPEALLAASERIRPDQTLIHGCAPVAFLVAHAVRLFKADKLGDKVFMTGGIPVDGAEPELARLSNRAGFPAYRPSQRNKDGTIVEPGELQAHYAARLFVAQAKNLGRPLPEIVINDRCRHSGENVAHARATGFMCDDDGDPVASVRVICQGYNGLRAGGTNALQAVTAFGDAAPVILPSPVWLQHGNISIHAGDWDRSPLCVRAPIYAEVARLTTGFRGEPNHYDQGHCQRMDIDAWQRQIEALALRPSQPKPRWTSFNHINQLQA